VTQPPPLNADGKKSALSEKLAFVLDDLIPIPGTQKRIGLDPLIGLIPGFGDFATSTAGAALLVAGVKKGIPRNVYLRMISNWTLNAIIGAIPFLGDLFSFWFKSNRRNQELLQAHIDEHGDEVSKNSGWWPFLILIGMILFVFSAVGLVIWLTARLLWG
jgi:hypothetical protein